jgi:hypothetical protein
LRRRIDHRIPPCWRDTHDDAVRGADPNTNICSHTNTDNCS